MSQSINDQFNSIKNNMNEINNLGNINEENFDEENDEDPTYEKEKKLISQKKLVVDFKNEKNKKFSTAVHKRSIHVNTEFNNEKFKATRENGKMTEEISKIDEMYASQFNKDLKDSEINSKNDKNEQIIFESSDGKLKTEDIKIVIKDKLELEKDKDIITKFNSDSRKKNNESYKIYNKLGENYMNNVEENASKATLNKQHTTKNMQSTLNPGSYETNFNKIDTDEESRMKFSFNKKPFLDKFFKKMKKLCDTSCQMVKWIEESYKWVECRYLKDHLKKNIKEHALNVADKGKTK